MKIEYSLSSGQHNGPEAAGMALRISSETMTISDREFSRFSKLMLRLSGITLLPGKKSLVVGRLRKRLHHYGLDSFGAYYDLATCRGAEKEQQQLLDLLTTNETYFFREPRHLEFLNDNILPGYCPNSPMKVWSAASSSGEEAYSIAMVLAQHFGLTAPWCVLGTDINQAVLGRARSGRYPVEAAEKIPPEYLKRYCLKGVGPEDGKLLMDRSLRARVQFRSFNLNGHWGALDSFDVIFLRNVMIYFSQDTRKALIEKIYQQLKPGGYLIIGHSESLHEISTRFQMIRPSIYRREA